MGLFGGYIIIFIIAVGTTAAIMPMVLKLATLRNWLAIPGERTVHTIPTPNVGGLGMFCGLAIALLVARQMDRFDRLFTGNSELVGVLLAAAIIALVGLRDDVREVSAPGRVAATIVAGLVLVWFGVTMFYFRLPFLGVFQISGDWVPIVTVLWLLVMTQAINLIDGLDGLAAGIVAIGSGAFFVYSWHLSDNGLLSEPNIGPLIAVITCGVCIGFLPFNFNPARIFMGDSGSYLLGLMMSVSTSVVGGRADPTTQGFSGQTYFFLAPLFIPLIILGVPIFDVLFAIVRRVSRGTGLATADKGHLHHRLINLGHGPRRAVVILWAWTLLLSGFVLYPVFNPSANSIVTFGLFGIVLFLYTVLHPDLRIRRERMRRDSEAVETESS
ncbi:MAG: undecaprenyl/decaprenyl-phosphate alpha-N-acetylglucosaminyl 1-phosphate transferase [Ilumatobacteraceae bacterium]|jgi:UDP-GlcNAc:undecaprenyl-phosphate GlcNAc-1-phosphate transferase|nr:undecaprenyl/decaprenyl-phosphate alpha-N-acetylglucosaminyl 1-phosphate transferase [Ilumatobacteraceae bacterium]